MMALSSFHLGVMGKVSQLDSQSHEKKKSPNDAKMLHAELQYGTYTPQADL